MFYLGMSGNGMTSISESSASANSGKCCSTVATYRVHTTLVTLVIAFSDQMTSLCPWPIRDDKKVVGMTRISVMTKINSK